MSSIKQQALLSHPNILSKGKSDVAGSFDFYTTMIIIYSLEMKDWKSLGQHRKSLQEFISNNQPIAYETYSALATTLPLIIHEYTHFYDCSSTVWGAKYLSIMTKAYTSDNLKYNGTEYDFHHAKKFHDLIRFLRLPAYYTEKKETIDDGHPWLYRQSIGHRFSHSGKVSDHPIIFTWFLNKDEEPLVRSPISIVSLLECAAMAQEISMNIRLMGLLEESLRNVELQLYIKQILGYIYNKDFTEYSVCAHLMANKYEESDILLIYQASAILCRLVLNTPPIIYSQISEAGNLKDIFGFSVEKEEIEKGLEYLDPTILYYLICHAMPIVKMNNLNDVFSLICEGLLRLGVSYDTLLEESKMEFLKYSDIAVNSEILSISSTAKAGQRNYELNNWSKADLDFTQLSLPPIYLNDFAQVNVFPDKENIFASINLDQLTDDLAEGQSWVEKFVEVCV